MPQSSLFKIAGAFLAGLLVALASALVYVRAHDRRPADSAPAVQLADAPEPPPAASPSPVPPPDESIAKPEKTSPAPEPARPVVKTNAVRPKPAKRQAPNTSAPVQVVQNTAPAYPEIHPPQASPADNGAVPANSEPPASASPPAPAPAPRQPHVVELPAGTNVVVRLGETISSERSQTGDVFRGTLAQPIIVNGFIIAERGANVQGKVVEADRAGRVKGVAALSLALTELNTTDRQRIEIDTNSVEKQGNKSNGSDAAKIAGGAAIGALIGALGGGGKGAAIGAGAGGAAGTGVVLGTRGKAAVIPNESELSFRLSNPVTITEKFN